MYVKLESILIDESLYPRNQVDWHDVVRYLSALRTGAELPPITVGKRKDGQIVLIDGRHRYDASRAAKRKTIAAVLSKLPERHWFAEAVRLNSRHGRPLSFQERLIAAMRLQQQKFSAAEVEKITGIQTEQLRKAIAERGLWLHPGDVKPVVLKAPVVPVATERGPEWMKAQAQNIKNEQEILSGQSVERLIEELIILLDNDLVPSSASGHLLRLQTAIERWFRGHGQAKAG